MIEDNKIIFVTNRVNGTVGYTIPDLNNLHRNFSSGETKKIEMQELRKLSYIAGGDIILRDCLVIKDAEAVAELLGKVEPEYNYTENEIMTLLTSGTLEQFLDCLDFAPKGVIDLIKEKAVSTKLNDVAKRQAILEKTGFNVTNAIEANELAEAAEGAPEINTERRAEPITAEVKPAETGRRTEPVNPIVTTTGKYEKIPAQK